MAYGESNGHVLHDVTCPSLLIGNWKHTYRTVNSDRALFHTSKTAKMIKVILLRAPCRRGCRIHWTELNWRLTYRK